VELDEYARIAATEDGHWWYRSTRALARDLLDPWLSSGLRVLDAGCGPGGNGAWLSAYGTVVGIDVEPEALRLVRARRPTTLPVRGSLTALPFARATFDVIAAVTVLYTVDDDRRAMEELARVLAPGGVLIGVEPAFDALRRAHDLQVHGRRRYRRARLATLATDAGLTVRRATYAYSFLVPPAAALALADRVRRGRGDGRTASARSDVDRRGLDRVFTPLAAAERRFLTRHDVPAGTSALVVATRG
jgi:SAM-dependent methyltransferase